MKRNLAGFLGLALLTLAPVQALERPDKEFAIFQFPPTMIPRIDGQTDDWDIVPESYVIGTEELAETVKGKGTNHDPEDLDVAVRVGWVNGLNRLYFLYEARDDYWNMHYRRGDIFEVAVDADRSGGPNINNPQLDQMGQPFRVQRSARAELPHFHAARRGAATGPSSGAASRGSVGCPTPTTRTPTILPRARAAD